MSFYTVYVGGERRDRENTISDIENVKKVLTLSGNGCYTSLYKDGVKIAQLEQVLDVLVSISYISGKNNLNAVINMITETEIDAYSIVEHGNDEECLDELSHNDFKIN